MDSTISTASTIFTLSKTLNSSSKPVISHINSHFSYSSSPQILHKRFTSFNSIQNLSVRGSFSPSSSRLGCISSTNSSYGGGGGAGGGGDDGGNGGGGGSSEGEIKSESGVVGSEEVTDLSTDVIILEVQGMSCGGCAGKVKRILESQPQVASANVILATETAFVWPVTEAKATQNWQQELGETLAKHLTSCGFKSNIRGASEEVPPS